MKILFLGQLGLNLNPSAQSDIRSERIVSLAQQLAKSGHAVNILSTRLYSPRFWQHYQGITLKKIPSLNPKKGGFIYCILSISKLWKQQPEVAHIHGWELPNLAWLGALLSPDTNLIWTIDTLPTNPSWKYKLTISLSRLFFDTITTPTRELQYRLLTELDLRTQYIPDGYTSPQLSNMATKHLGLRKDQYCIAICDRYETLKNMAFAYNSTKSRKKLVALQSESLKTKRLVKQYKFLQILNPVSGRRLRSLLRQAAIVIVGDNSFPLSELLQTMDGQRAIIASTAPLYQETLGVTAQFYKPNDIKGLRSALQNVIAKKPQQAKWGQKAADRAKRHFTWERIFPEYLAIYHAIRIPVSIDSLQKTHYYLSV